MRSSGGVDLPAISGQSHEADARPAQVEEPLREPNREADRRIHLKCDERGDEGALSNCDLTGHEEADEADRTRDRVHDQHLADRYRADEYARDAAAVLDACGADRALLVGLSLGAKYGTRFAWMYPDRVLGLVMIGPSLALGIGVPERKVIAERLYEVVEEPRGWEKYNVGYWYSHYTDFTEFFFAQCFSEPHSTKPREDAVGWAAETGPEILEAESHAPEPEPGDREALAGLTCPVLVIHGAEDRIAAHAAGEEAARLTGGALATLAGSGHIPNVRDPVKVNLLLHDFVERVSS